MSEGAQTRKEQKRPCMSTMDELICRVALENAHWIGSLEFEFHLCFSLTPRVTLAWSVYHSGSQSSYLLNWDNNIT